jgi:hypothetical protein
MKKNNFHDIGRKPEMIFSALQGTKIAPNPKPAASQKKRTSEYRHSLPNEFVQ